MYKTNASSQVAMHIIDVWYDCAMHDDCIALQWYLNCNFSLAKLCSTKYRMCSERRDCERIGKKVYKYIRMLGNPLL